MSSRNLNTLFIQIDDWFSELTSEPPIGQFQLQVSRRDRAKLAIIKRTTSNWFKGLNALEPLTNEGLNIDLDRSNLIDEVARGKDSKQTFSKLKSTIRKGATKTKPIKKATRRNTHKDEEAESRQLDLMAKDLEDLLDAKVEKEPEYYFCQYHYSDEASLQLDDSIGLCLTLFEHGANPSKRTSRLLSRNDDFCKPSTYTSVTMTTRSRASSIANRSTQNNGSVMTSTPAPTDDHDYAHTRSLAHPNTFTSNLLFRGKLQQALINKTARRAAKELRDTNQSVLNTGAIRRFARFSDRLRVLSEKQESIRLQA